MNKQEYIDMLVIDNETSGDKKDLYDNVIECVELALSQMPSNFEPNGSIGLEDLYDEIEKEARRRKKGACVCIGMYDAAEILAKKLGAQYARVARRESASDVVDLEEFF